MNERLRKLNRGDCTTRDEIKLYADSAGISLAEACQIICDAFVESGYHQESDALWLLEGECIGVDKQDLTIYRANKSHQSFQEAFSRHLTPYQILMAKKPIDADPQLSEDVPQHEAPTLEYTRDIQDVIESYLHLLDVVKDKDAREVIFTQLADLTDLQFKQLGGGV